MPHLEVLMGNEDLGWPSHEKRNISCSGQGILSTGEGCVLKPCSRLGSSWDLFLLPIDKPLLAGLSKPIFNFNEICKCGER